MSLFHHERNSDRSDEYATPRTFIEPVRDAVDGFDLDPASGAEDTPIASTRYTQDDDGLEQPWFGTVWCNPPFSLKSEFLEKALTEHQDENTDLTLVLLPVDVSTGWFHDYVTQADLLWFKRGRMSFDGGGGRNRNPNFGIMLAVFGDAPDELREYLSHHGVVFDQTDRFERSTQTELPA